MPRFIFKFGFESVELFLDERLPLFCDLLLGFVHLAEGFFKVSPDLLVQRGSSQDDLEVGDQAGQPGPLVFNDFVAWVSLRHF